MSHPEGWFILEKDVIQWGGVSHPDSWPTHEMNKIEVAAGCVGRERGVIDMSLVSIERASRRTGNRTQGVTQEPETTS